MPISRRQLCEQHYSVYPACMRRLAITIASIALLAGGVSVAVACNGGTADGNAGRNQYHQKPGCGPDKTEGVAGNSGYHDGQPPKDDNRGDCPEPPGQHHDWLARRLN